MRKDRRGKGQSFMTGALLLGISNILVKLIGTLYRIPMTNILGTEGMGIYQKAFPIYSTLLVLSTAGIPTAISKTVSEHFSQGDTAGARRVFTVALELLAVVGGLTAILLFVFREQAARYLVEDPLAAMSIGAIAPSLFFASVMSAFRGYFQGMQHMLPTATSQLVEQVGKLAVGVVLAVRLIGQGIEFGAAGAMIGVTVSELAALTLMVVIFLVHIAREGRVKAPKVPGKRPLRRETAGSVLKRLLPIAIPVTLGGCIIPLTSLVDAKLVTPILESIGYTVGQARSMYGNLTGAVNTLVNLPGALSLALCISLVPAVAAAKRAGNEAKIRSQTLGGLKVTMLVGLPCGAGLAVLASQIISLLYGGSMTAEEISTAAGLLQLMLPAVVALGVVQTLNGILQGLGKVYIPVLSLGAGAAVKVLLNLVLIRIPVLNIYGAAIASSACYTVAAVINLIYVRRYLQIRYSFGDLVLLPGLATLGMTAAVEAMLLLGHTAMGRHPNLLTLLAVAVGMVVYALLLPLLGALSHEDMGMIPGGRKLEALLVKLKLMKPATGKHMR